MAQAVLLTLHLKNLEYSFLTAVGPQTIIESYKQGVPCPLWRPALWYNGKCYYESSNIMQLLDEKHSDSKHPRLFNAELREEEVSCNLNHLKMLFSYAQTRVVGKKKLQFWYEWSIQKDKTSSEMHRFFSRLFRPFTTLYLWVLINLSYHIMCKGSWPEESFRQSVAYFSQKLKESSGSFIKGSSLTYIDLLLLGHFQCMFSGSNGFGPLSKEVLPIIDEYPLVWQWLKRMHQYPPLLDYPYMFSRCNLDVLQRTGNNGIKVDPDDILGQVTFWFGVLLMLTVWPITLLALFLVIGTRIWNAKRKSRIDTIFQFKLRKQE